MAVVSGVCASMMNVGFAYGTPLVIAAAHGANSLWVTDAIWVPLMAGGAVPNVLYCVYLLTKRKTASDYGSTARPQPAARLRHGLALVRQQRSLWHRHRVPRRVRASSRLAAVHVAHRHRRSASRRVDRRVARRGQNTPYVYRGSPSGGDAAVVVLSRASF